MHSKSKAIKLEVDQAVVSLVDKEAMRSKQTNIAEKLKVRGDGYRCIDICVLEYVYAFGCFSHASVCLHLVCLYCRILLLLMCLYTVYLCLSSYASVCKMTMADME